MEVTNLPDSSVAPMIFLEIPSQSLYSTNKYKQANEKKNFFGDQKKRERKGKERKGKERKGKERGRSLPSLCLSN
jgi:hypothetical protein